MWKILLILLTLGILCALAYIPLKNYLENQQASTKPVTITVWVVNEQIPVLQKIIAEYKSAHPNVTVNVVDQAQLNYRTRVQTQILQNTGPDIFMVHNSWIPMFLQTKTITPMPSKIMTPQQFAEEFYPVTTQTLVLNKQIYALPIEIDGLALFYNKDILAEDHLSVPHTWEEFTTAAEKSVKKDERGNITRSGAALGTSTNVDYWSDIIGLLFSQQPKANIVQPASDPGVGVFRYYASFLNDDLHKRVWDAGGESSVQSFAKGNVAFIFAKAEKIKQIKQLNPNLNFATTPVPQTPESNSGWGSFWAYAVSSKSKASAQAWDFLSFLTSADSEKAMNQESLAQGLVPHPYSRVSLQKEQVDDPILGAFVAQGPSYKSWYLSSGTQDQGINDEMITLFKDPVDITARGGNPQQSLAQIQGTIPILLRKYFP